MSQAALRFWYAPGIGSLNQNVRSLCFCVFLGPKKGQLTVTALIVSRSVQLSFGDQVPLLPSVTLPQQQGGVPQLVPSRLTADGCRFYYCNNIIETCVYVYICMYLHVCRRTHICAYMLFSLALSLSRPAAILVNAVVNASLPSCLVDC